MIDSCKAVNVKIATDAENLAESATGLLIGQAVSSQFMGADGRILDITETGISADSINSTADVKIVRADGSEHADATLVCQVPEMK